MLVHARVLLCAVAIFLRGRSDVVFRSVPMWSAVLSLPYRCRKRRRLLSLAFPILGVLFPPVDLVGLCRGLGGSYAVMGLFVLVLLFLCRFPFPLLRFVILGGVLIRWV